MQLLAIVLVLVTPCFVVAHLDLKRISQRALERVFTLRVPQEIRE